MTTPCLSVQSSSEYPMPDSLPRSQGHQVHNLPAGLFCNKSSLVYGSPTKLLPMHGVGYVPPSMQQSFFCRHLSPCETGQPGLSVEGSEQRLVWVGICVKFSHFYCCRHRHFADTKDDQKTNKIVRFMYILSAKEYPSCVTGSPQIIFVLHSGFGVLAGKGMIVRDMYARSQINGVLFCGWVSRLQM